MKIFSPQNPLGTRLLPHNHEFFSREEVYLPAEGMESDLLQQIKREDLAEETASL